MVRVLFSQSKTDRDETATTNRLRGALTDIDAALLLTSARSAFADAL
jgi:hypothetical protein